MLEKRIVAYLIDRAILYTYIVCVAVVLAIACNMARSFGNSDLADAIGILIVAGCMLGELWFNFLRDAIGGRSPGKRIMNLKICDKNCAAPTWWRLILRDIFTPVVLIEGFLYLFWKMTLGDKLSGTYTTTIDDCV